MNCDCECGEYPCPECGHCNCPEWISVKYEMPKDEAILYHPFKRVDGTDNFIIFVGYWDNLNKEWTCSFSGMFPFCEDNYCQSFIMDNYRLKKNQVTHWMPLPLPPK